MSILSRPAVFALFVACLGLGPAGAFAERPTDGMRAALAVIPQAAIPVEGSSPLQIEYGDPGAMAPVVALQALRGEMDFPPEAAALTRSLPGDMRNSAMLTQPEGFEAATGLRLTDLGPLLAVSRPPERLTLLSIGPGAAPRMVAALQANGHGMVEDRGGAVILSRGEDFAINPLGREPANPFGGALGQSTRFLVAEGKVLHAPATPILEAVIEGAGPRLSEHPGLVALLAGLDAGAEGAGGLIHATAILGMGGRDLLIADLANGTEETGMLVIALPDTAAAEALAARLTQDWPTLTSQVTGGPYAALFEGPVTIAAHPGTPASVTLRRSQPRDFAEPIFSNPVAGRFQTMVFMGDVGGLIAP